jgi:DNA polymerase-3 subunit epsilon
MADRHRASGDALATVKLFKMLLERFRKTIITDLIKAAVQKELLKLT